MADSFMDKAKAKAKEAEGMAREKIGEWTGDEEEEARGEAQQFEGKAREKGAEVKDKAKDITN